MIAHGAEAPTHSAGAIAAGTIAAGQRIIRWHAGWAAGASIIPLPFADMAGVMAVQVSMVRRLARLHGSRMDGARARTLVLSALGGAASPTVTASGIPSMLKAVPGIGTVLGGVAAPASAVAATVALGNFFNHRFAEIKAPIVPAAAETRAPPCEPTPPEPATLAPDTLPPDAPPPETAAAAASRLAGEPPATATPEEKAAAVKAAAPDPSPPATTADAERPTEKRPAAERRTRARRTKGRAARKPAGDKSE